MYALLNKKVFHTKLEIHFLKIPIKDNYIDAQRIEALSLYGSRWALSEDSGFKYYSSRPEVYLVKKRGAIDNNYGRQ